MLLDTVSTTCGSEWVRSCAAAEILNTGVKAYVETPDGSRVGLVWSTGAFAAKWVRPLREHHQGVYEVAFPKPVKNLRDPVECFRSVVPQLQTLVAGDGRRSSAIRAGKFLLHADERHVAHS